MARDATKGNGAKGNGADPESRICFNCEETVVTGTDGGCPVCGHRIAQPDQLMYFFCEQCDSDFESICDVSGNQQASCPKCNSISYSDTFHQEMIQKEQNESNAALVWLWKFLVFISIVAGMALVKFLF